VPETLLEPPGEDSATVRCRVEEARDRQKHRYRNCSWRWNAGLPPGDIQKYTVLDHASRTYFLEAVRKLGLSSRAAHGVLRIGRTLADLSGRNRMTVDDILEAVQHRRYGDRDLFWTAL
jgi:magnesium chelatase family protein